MKHEFKTEKTEEGREGTLTLWGDLDMSSARESKAVLLEALQSVDVIHLNLQDVKTADVSLIQLICAAHRECTSSGKKITLYEPGEVVGELLSKAGYCKQLGCPEGLKGTCLWANAKVSC